MRKLLNALRHEISRVVIGRSLRPAGNIELFVRSASGYSLVFDAREFPVPVCRQKWPQIFNIEIVTGITIEVAICWIPGVPFLRTPDLFVRFPVSVENRGTGTGKARCVDCGSWAGISKYQSVRIQDKPANFRFAKVLFHSGEIGAFR